MSNLLDGVKNIMGRDYKRFCHSMLDAAENDMLPVGLQFDNADSLTGKDIKDLYTQFEEDTGLEITTTFFMCRNCGCLHALFEVDYPTEEEEEEDNTYLQ